MQNIKGYNPSFTKIHRFMEKHLNACTEAECNALAKDMGKFHTAFEADMAVAVLNEIERRNRAEAQP